jgi:hypothetical protein
MLECENWVQDFHGHEMGYKKNFRRLGLGSLEVSLNNFFFNH